MSIDNVDDVAVVRAPDDPDPFGLQIAIVGKGQIDLFEVMDQLCRRLARPTARKHIKLYELAELPRNPAGKVDRRALIDRLKSAPVMYP